MQFITLYPPEPLLKMKDDNNDIDKEACCTTSDMTDNPAYGTTRRITANLPYNTTANWCSSTDKKSIVMHKNPTYTTSTAAGTMCNMYRDN